MDASLYSVLGLHQYLFGLDFVAELVECIEDGFVTDRSDVGSLEVGLTVVNILRIQLFTK